MAIEPKIIITGTGRAGTTMLVELLTELGLNTGIVGERKKDYDSEAAAGFEHDILEPTAPRIVKHPNLTIRLRSILEEGKIPIGHALIPIRELNAAAQSRIRRSDSGTHQHVAGGLWGTEDPRKQHDFLATAFYGLIHTLVEYEIPFTFLEFPRFANDAEYLRRQLLPVFPEIAEADFGAVFQAVSKPERIHTFDSKDTTPSVAYRKAQLRIRLGALQRRILSPFRKDT